MNKDYFLGLDIGSVSLKTAIIDKDKNIIDVSYTRINGQPVLTTYKILEDIFSRFSPTYINKIGITGSGGKFIGELLDACFINEIIVQARATGLLYPEVKTVIEIGGEDSKLILLAYDKNLGTSNIVDFSMNNVCAAGTGSFLDQQAHRLDISIEEEFGQLALKSKNPPRIAGRCSVFAKSDMIHLQQEATPDYDIVSGLCYAMARNYKSTIAKGRNIQKKIAFHGGVAANKGMLRAFEDIFELGPEELIIPKYYAVMGAIGAAITIAEDKKHENITVSLNKINSFLQMPLQTKAELESLSFYKGEKTSLSKMLPPSLFQKLIKKMPIYLGIDIGSISTNVVAIDEHNNLLSKRYLMTAGRPIEAVRKGLTEVGKEVGTHIEVKGVGTTGSGRYMIGDLIGADIVKNEITAQARAAAEIDPDVDTIFEIGGQDSKYISLSNGAIVDFEMNKACAAGTGSFLEEQAERLGINIKEEFGALALSAPSPVSLGERCTVFMESDLVHHQQQGAPKDNLVAGLSYSIVYNYLNRVVLDKKIGDHIFFQGGVAANKGVVAAFEKVTGKPITVPEHHDVTGAIGTAIIAKEENTKGYSNFKGFDLSQREYSIASFECKECANLCEIKKISIKNETDLFYGSRCEKYNIKKQTSASNDIPNLFQEREQYLLTPYKKNPHPTLSQRKRATDQNPLSLGKDRMRGTIGLPRALFFHEFYPFWQAFFIELGFKVILSDQTNKNIINIGLEKILSETCLPIKVTHGHIQNLLDKDVDYIFLPSLIDVNNDDQKQRSSLSCPYVQAIPYIIKCAFNLNQARTKFITIPLYVQFGSHDFIKALSDLARMVGVNNRHQIKKAFNCASKFQQEFYNKIEQRGQEVLDGLKNDNQALVIASRYYNGCDNGINLNLPKKLKGLNIIAIPMDFIPLHLYVLADEWPNMYWRYGQKILKIANLIKNDRRLNAIYLTNFSCGPDSFLCRFFSEQMGDKPFLQIEIDEHSADAGVITRCEAFLDSLKNIKPSSKKIKAKLSDKVYRNVTTQKKTLYIPYMSDHALAIRAALLGCGIPAEVMPESDVETLLWGRKYTTGKECYPCIITTGDMVKFTKRPDFDPKKSAFLMPSGDGPCRFGQFCTLHRLILNELGLEDVPIFNPNQDADFYQEIEGGVGKDFNQKCWKGIIAVDFLTKLLHEIRPYESKPGETDEVYNYYLYNLCESIINNKDTLKVIEEARHVFKEIKTNQSGQRPIIGVVGEIFVRANRFSNNNIIKQIENLGGEVWIAPISEWFFYINYTGKMKSRLNKDFSLYLRNSIIDWFQKREEHRLTKLVKGYIKNYDEPPIKQTLQYSLPYIHPSFEGEAVLSIGKAIDFIKKGVSGIISTMPFTCMPGTIVSGFLKKLKEDYTDIPCLNMTYDGQEETNAQIRLEAFMYQAKQYRVTR
ncbi:MAG: acyl-CoA dehydratase activase [bacterium]